MSHVSPARSLDRVLRAKLAELPARLLVGEVVSAPDGEHVVVELAGVNVTVPRLSHYRPAAGEACYLIAQGDRIVAAGSVAADTGTWHEVGAAGEPAFQNGWANYGGGWPGAAFRRGVDGRVHLRGLVAGGQHGTSTPMFVLPAGYRPAGNAHFPTVTGGAFDYVHVLTPGGVSNNVGPAPAWVSLEGITFDAA